MVVDGGGSMRNALLGDMLAEKAAKNGWEGLVIFGCIRDIDVIMETDVGVQALAVHP
jgi:regulator of ribonuclease activity A